MLSKKMTSSKQKDCEFIIYFHFIFILFYVTFIIIIDRQNAEYPFYMY